jgi:UDP-N-acetylmuramoyl-L-alanyl-D-glutamate--2,6-diaminopimelate ligase
LELDVPVITVPESLLRGLVAHVSALVTGSPQLRCELVGVTGTNGKTSVTSIVGDLARALSWNGANIGTLTNERTTPAAPELMRSLKTIVDGFDTAKSRSVVALEISSHAIDQGRITGLQFAVVAFTNLSHDHLDYHGSMEEYFEVKSRLFTREYTQRCVIWCDDPYGQRLASETQLAVSEVRRSDATEVVQTVTGTTFFWRGQLVNTPLIGDYNIDNALLAMAIISSLGASDGAIAGAMEFVRNIPGRFEVIRGSSITAIVDYAHTPEGLRRILNDVRLLSPASRIVTVFGCGGDRDTSKRPEMGRVASKLSDVTIITSDNPRSESPDAIIEAVMSGCDPGSVVYVQSDRRAAISQAMKLANAGDVVVIAGKGHETTQMIGDVELKFDDRVVARELVK